VTSVSEHGIYVAVQPGVDAFVPGGEIPEGVSPSRGDKVRAEITNIDAMDRRITMSLRGGGETPAADQAKGAQREQTASSQSGTLGELLKQKFGDKLSSMAQQDSAATSDAETEG
jgi:ribosomal protein S1